MSYTAADGRQQILSELASAIDELAISLAALGAAYERLDETTSDRLEEQLFRPVQLAYGRAKRTHSEFAGRHGIPPASFPEASPGLESQDARALIDRAATAARQADDEIATLQDSMLPVEVGDTDLRAGLAEVRSLIDPVPGRATRLISTVGR
jgi:hypothetical protein